MFQFQFLRENEELPPQIFIDITQTIESYASHNKDNDYVHGEKHLLNYICKIVGWDTESNDY